MKTIHLFIALLLTSIVSTAQDSGIKTGSITKICQQLGNTEAIINYERIPVSIKTSYGNRISNGKIWRFGINQPAVLTLTENALVNGIQVDKGDYSVIAIPNDEEWTIILNSKIQGNIPFQHNTKKDILSVSIKKEKFTNLDRSHTISYENITSKSANLVFRLDKFQLKLTISESIDKNLVAEITKKVSKTDANPFDLSQAAYYYFEKNYNLEQALLWVTTAAEKLKSAFSYTLKAQIAQKLGKHNVAIEAAKKAIEYANNEEVHNTQINAEDIIKISEAKLIGYNK